MEIVPGPITIKLSPREARALVLGLTDLKILKEQNPDARNGFDLVSQEIVSKFRNELKTSLFTLDAPI